MKSEIIDPNENTKSYILRHDIDHNPDLENFLTAEEINRILAMTVFVCSIVWLINTFGW